ncbi:MAG: Cof-type HAD-IIB family hydrolase [Anaerolineae bacterium]|jgi:Cof subfamily protein (haloacid dehalogenase superfamily)|nr:Cof-type HAD-IIB family hydrolase [Anaerolineae bacterium]
MIKLIVTDLDGTLLTSAHQMTERTEQALKAAINQGVKVVLATGKTRHSGNDIIQRLNLTTPGIYLQGISVHYPDNSVKHQQQLDVKVLRRVITFAEDRGFEVVAYSGTRILAARKNPATQDLHTKYHEPEPEIVGSLHNLIGTTTINKLLIIKLGDPRKITALRWQLSKQLDSKEARLVQALPDMLEILPPNASKGAALKTLLRELDIKPEEVLAIGDAENDLEMIQMAGIGVAVGNAIDKLKSVANYVVASNDEDGVAEAVERFVLKKADEIIPTPTPLPLITEEKPEAKAETEATPNPESKSESEATETPTTPVTESKSE